MHKHISLALTAAIVVFFSISKTSAEEDPTVTKDSDDLIDVADNITVTFTASGGSTDEPSDGCPPWNLTGNRKYTWHVNQIESGPLPTDPNDGDETTDDTLTVDGSDETPGKISVSASLKEEWEDSSSPPKRDYYPQD